jgi:hypothetical protein
VVWDTKVMILIASVPRVNNRHRTELYLDWSHYVALVECYTYQAKPFIEEILFYFLQVNGKSVNG